MTFKVVCKRGGKFLAKITFEGEDKWFTATKAVYNYAQKNFEEGDDVDIEYNTKNGQYFVTKIMKTGSGTKSTSTPEEPKEEGKYYCEDCGKELKDGKYKKCYACNKKNPTKKAPKGSYNNPTDTEATRRSKLAVLGSCATAITALAGQVDANALGDVLESLYDKMYKKLFG